MNVSLPPDLNRWVEEHVASGLYSSASEVVVEALRLLRERDNLRLLIQAGLEDLDAGRVEPADDAIFEWIAAEGARPGAFAVTSRAGMKSSRSKPTVTR